VYGPRQNPEGEAGVVAIFSWAMLRDAETAINGNGDQERDFIYVGDCVKANQIAIEGGINGVYNIGTGAGTTINQLHTLLAQNTGYQGKKTHAKAKIGETKRIFLDVKRAEQEMGWKPMTGLDEGLERTVEHFRNVRGIRQAAHQQ
jgi:UDP-glucose 4-epimerase